MGTHGRLIPTAPYQPSPCPSPLRGFEKSKSHDIVPRPLPTPSSQLGHGRGCANYLPTGATCPAAALASTVSTDPPPPLSPTEAGGRSEGGEGGDRGADRSWARTTPLGRGWKANGKCSAVRCASPSPSSSSSCGHRRRTPPPIPATDPLPSHRSLTTRRNDAGRAAQWSGQHPPPASLTTAHGPYEARGNEPLLDGWRWRAPLRHCWPGPIPPPVPPPRV